MTTLSDLQLYLSFMSPIAWEAICTSQASPYEGLVAQTED